MRISKEYKEAMAEVLCVLRHCDEEVISNIPLDVIKGLKQNAVNTEEYDKKFEAFHDDITVLNLKQETIALLATIYKKYLCSEEERVEYDKKLLKAEELLKEDAVSSEIFKVNTAKETKEYDEKENLPKEIKKEGFFSKLIRKIKSVFGSNN